MTDFRSRLAERAEQEAMACIGCHDCMLACPLPEARLIGIAELNTAVFEPTITNPRVVQFVTSCTQCRQCVPACPADLSRADMVLFNKRKVEDAVPDYVVLVQRGAYVAPSRFTLDRLVDELANLRLFAGAAKPDLRRALLASTLREVAEGEVLCQVSEFYERLCVVLEGALEQTAPVGLRSPGRARRILLLPPGSFFGELAVLSDQPEPFTVAAVMAATVLELPRAVVLRLMEQSPAFRETMEDLYSKRAIHSYAHKPGALGALPEPAVGELLAAATLELHREGEHVLREGDRPTDLFIVRSGFLRVTKRVPAPPDASGQPAWSERSLLYFREGDLFGALPLLLGEPAHAMSVHAASRTEVIRIPGGVFQQVLSRYPAVRTSLPRAALDAERAARVQADRLSQPLAGPASVRAPVAAGGPSSLSWNQLVEEGLAKGREILVVDQTRCTACNNCIDACGRRHGESRLELRGVQMDTLMFPTACRHCEDPVCLLCSVNGIVRLPSGEITIVPDNCIGCGACAERCPYGNIRMHPVTAPKKSAWDELLQFLTGKPPAGAAKEHDDPTVARKAVKCDLCAGHDDYACVTACPVGAAFRIDPATVLGAAGRVPTGRR